MKCAGVSVAGVFSAFREIGWGVIWRAEAVGGGCSAVDLVEDLADEFRIGDVHYDPQLPSAPPEAVRAAACCCVSTMFSR